MRALKKLLQTISPEFALLKYHHLRAAYAVWKNNYPARKMVIIGITGTKGKTSTANYVWSVLRAGGMRTGLISTANFRFDDEEEANTFHMTMPSAFLIQTKLRQMYEKGIQVAVVEMTSEGMKQYRHLGIPVDIAIFTNLTPEHLNSHKGNFEIYKRAKSPLFKSVSKHPRKVIDGKEIPRVIIANADSEHSLYYLQFEADQKITYGLEHGDVRATHVVTSKNDTTFVADDELCRLSIPGTFNIYNALPAFVVGTVLDIPKNDIKIGLEGLNLIPGRMELINEGQGFTVVVDYAHEPASLGALMSAADTLKDPLGKTILIIGVIGGGRQSRVPMARLGAQRADILIITNEDPYEYDPEVLIQELATVAQEEGKRIDENLFTFTDRREAITHALTLASAGDIVLVSGKGAEQTMITKHGPIPWNERAIVRELVREHAQK